MKTRFLLVLVCLLVSLSLLLTACGGGSTQPSPSTSAATTKTTAPPTSTAATPSTQTTTTAVTTTAVTTTTGANNSLIDILGLGENINSIKFDLSMTMTGQDPITMTIWQKQQKMREDVTVTGMTVSIIFDVPENTMYTYMPEQNMATKAALDISMLPDSPIQDTRSIMDYNPLVTGTETIDGKVCTVVEYNENNVGNIKMWIWEAKGLPLKMELTSGGEKTTIEYTNIDFSDIPDSIFELPDGVTIIG